MKAKKALKTDPANRRSPAERPNTNGKTCEWVTVMDCNMTCAVGKRMRQRLTQSCAAGRQARPNERRVSRLKGNDMTKMIDTEGDALPNNGPDDKYDNCWDINLWGDGELSLSIPMSFDAGDGGNYNGAGVVTVGLRELLQEYLDDCDRLDGGEGLQPLAAMFREFADKYEAAVKQPNAV